MKRPLLSILIPTYNRAEMTIQCVESIGKHDDLEIVIVDDGSPLDEWFKITRNDDVYNNPSILLCHNCTNLGMVRNFNKCMEHATGEWFCLIGSDDLFRRGAVGRILDYLRKQTEPALIVHSRCAKFTRSEPGHESAKAMRLPSGSGNLWHRSIYEDLGGFDTKLEFSPDAEYWRRIAVKYPVVGTPDKFTIYRQHENNIMWSMWRQREKMFSQVALLSKINMVHFGEDVTDLDVVAQNQSEALWETVSYILRKTSRMPSKHDIFDMYLAKGNNLAYTEDRKNLIAQLVKARES